MRVILYARVSTRGQAEKGYSLRQQIEALEAYASQQGWGVVAVIEDDGYSGATLERPGTDRVREIVETGSVDLVVAQDRTRARVSLLAGDRVHQVLYQADSYQRLGR